MKKLITSLLVAVFVIIPFQAKTDPPPSNDEEKAGRAVGAVVTALVVVAVGMVVITGLKKMCRKLPPIGGSTNLPPALDDISKRNPRIDSPTNVESSMVSFEQFDGVAWQETITVAFDDNMNAVVTKNGEVVHANIPVYTVPSSNGEFLVYYDMRQIWIEQKPFAFFRLMSQ